MLKMLTLRAAEKVKEVQEELKLRRERREDWEGENKVHLLCAGYSTMCFTCDRPVHLPIVLG